MEEQRVSLSWPLYLFDRVDYVIIDLDYKRCRTMRNNRRVSYLFEKVCPDD